MTRRRLRLGPPISLVAAPPRPPVLNHDASGCGIPSRSVTLATAPGVQLGVPRIESCYFLTRDKAQSQSLARPATTSNRLSGRRLSRAGLLILAVPKNPATPCQSRSGLPPFVVFRSTHFRPRSSELETGETVILSPSRHSTLAFQVAQSTVHHRNIYSSQYSPLLSRGR